MKTLRKFIEILVAIESSLTRRKSTRRATIAAVSMVLKGSRM